MKDGLTCGWWLCWVGSGRGSIAGCLASIFLPSGRDLNTKILTIFFLGVFIKACWLFESYQGQLSLKNSIMKLGV